MKKQSTKLKYFNRNDNSVGRELDDQKSLWDCSGYLPNPSIPRVFDNMCKDLRRKQLEQNFGL